jgi:hypothetical protein
MKDPFPYADYYSLQAGNGIAGFQGLKYQRGHGFFGSLFRQVLKPLAKYLGRKALSTGVDIGSDILQGENFKESAKKRLKTTGRSMVDDAIERVKTFAQTGKGCKRVKTLCQTGKRRKRKTKPRKSRKSKKNKNKKKSKKSLKKKVKRRKPSKKKPVKKKKSISKDLKHIFT